MAIDNWFTSPAGHLIAERNDEPVGYVYRLDDHSWKAVWFGDPGYRAHRLKSSSGSAEALQKLLETVEAGFFDPKQWDRDSDWKQSPSGHHRMSMGAMGTLPFKISVKKARSGSWYATVSGMILGEGNRPTWFDDEYDAMNAVDEISSYRGAWRWIARD